MPQEAAQWLTLVKDIRGRYTYFLADKLVRDHWQWLLFQRLLSWTLSALIIIHLDRRNSPSWSILNTAVQPHSNATFAVLALEDNNSARPLQVNYSLNKTTWIAMTYAVINAKDTVPFRIKNIDDPGAEKFASIKSVTQQRHGESICTRTTQSWRCCCCSVPWCKNNRQSVHEDHQR